MHTMVQDDDNDYDIDDGAVFLRDDLKGAQGADKSALDARKMVRDAIDDGSFATAPVVLKNCVRVQYQQGYHVDIPVYRELADGTLELASSDWKGSSPSEVTTWFNDSVKAADTVHGCGDQLRRTTRETKAFARSWQSWKPKMPSGLVLSVLVVELFCARARPDETFRDTLQAIYNRLCWNLAVKHPVRPEWIKDGQEDAEMVFLRDKLAGALDTLEVLDDPDCKRSQALRAWGKVFNHQFWEERAKEAEAEEKEASKLARAALLRGGNRGIAPVAGLVAAGTCHGAPMKTTHAYGGVGETR